MKTPQQIAALVPSLTLPEALDLIADLVVERERYLRRAVVSELALKRLVRELNPNLSEGKFEGEIGRILGSVEDDRDEVLMKVNEERWL